jgi:hypothetical protein
MRKDRFTDEALAQATALAELKMNDVESFAEAYDYARCQRPDGSFYGIPSGKQCRKGSKTVPAKSVINSILSTNRWKNTRSPRVKS